MNKRIYLDNNAATPVDPQVIKVVEQYLQNHLGNPSSIHSYGRECRQVLTKSRDTIAQYLGVRSDEIVFTSGGTEGANMILRGLLQKNPNAHIITSSVEHSCVYSTLKELEKLGFEVTYLDPGAWGSVKPEEVQKAIRPNTKLIAIMAANNETGVKSNVEGIAAIAQQEELFYFVDAVAILGKEPLHIPEGVSAMCFSGQKIHALQGIGFCFIRKKLKLLPLLTGGGHQYGRRAGTENLPGIVALSKAVSLIKEELSDAPNRISKLRDYFENALKERLENILVNGEGPRVGNTSNLCFQGVDGESLLTALDMEGIAVSHGSACASGALEPSRVLLNMGLPIDRVNSSVRFSFSRYTTEQEVERAVEVISRLAKKYSAGIGSS